MPHPTPPRLDHDAIRHRNIAGRYTSRCSQVSGNASRSTARNPSAQTYRSGQETPARNWDIAYLGRLSDRRAAARSPGLDLATGKVHYRIRDRKRWREFLDFLKTLHRR